ncbi:MAG: hypothetical protein GVY32_12795 [Gammaproteobacteria bacterium]|jgi:hypothetical protein|nr:hypothetical protein [Gammaproteobacteria bacterium]
MRRSRSHFLLSLALASALLARSLIAPGYMPDGESGGTVRLCHSGIDGAAAAVLFHAHAGHSHGTQNDGPTSDQLCPLGDGLGAAQLPDTPKLAALLPPPARPLEPASVRLEADPARGFEARAPPVPMV